MTVSGMGARSGGVSPRMLDRSTLRDQAVDVLRALIVTGEIPVGERVNEVELASMLGISRGPLREGIQRLGAEGLIEFRQNRGAFVREVSLEDVRQMYELREVLEVKAARLAALRATDGDIKILENQIGALDTLLHAKKGPAHTIEFESASVLADLDDFHGLVLQVAKNSYLQRAGMDLQVQLRIARLRASISAERASEALEEHRAVLAAIASRREAAAGKAMATHLRNSLARNTFDPR
jgi:DNA-binding GntR family transcriptional regulator